MSEQLNLPPDNAPPVPAYQGDHLGPLKEQATERQATTVGGAALEMSNRLDNPSSFVHVKAPGLEEMAVSSVVEVWRQEREAILALPSHEEGLHMERVNAFCQDLEMPPKPVRILAPDDFRRALVITGSPGGSDYDGKYLPKQDVIIVKRDPEMETLNGIGYTESAVVHERAHATMETVSVEATVELSKKRGLLKRGIIASVTPKDERAGFEVVNKSGDAEGTYLEEGWAELARGRYVVEQLGLPDGLAGRFQPDKSNLLDKYGVYERRVSGEVVKTLPPGARAAVALEVLIERGPGLLSALRSARGSVEGLREVARLIDHASPGLYREMRKVNLEIDDGRTQATRIVKKVRALE